MKFDIRVTVKDDEVSGMIDTTQCINLFASIYDIEIDSEYVENTDTTFEFRYKFDLTDEKIKQMQELYYNPNNIVDNYS